jgi:hypothetical protein
MGKKPEEAFLLRIKIQKVKMPAKTLPAGISTYSRLSVRPKALVGCIWPIEGVY